MPLKNKCILMKLLQFYFALTAMILITVAGSAKSVAGAEKIPLKVLYVGYKPERPMPSTIVYYSTSLPVVERVYKTRMADFKRFLEERFTTVDIVDARDYSPSMSDAADVTIMDAGPVKLPADFNRPMILMHAMAPNVGLPIGLKFDWYCQCLDDDALNINTRHEIFNSPKKVKLTLAKKPTPGSFFNGFQGAKTPKEMPMWNVIKPGSNANGKYIIGMVSHGEGFNDSPDAEAISGGVCLKNAEAVALGRQGNYFMWGFAASPDYMSDEAKDVFVNAVVYIKKYDHKPAILKKVQVETRELIDEKIYRIDKDLYEKAILSRREGNTRLLKLQQEMRDRKAAGEDIGRGNEMFLKMPPTNDVESFEDYLKGQAGEQLFKKFGTNTSLYHQYYRSNYEYFYPSDAYNLQLDEDAKKTGISNRKVALLEKCVQMLEKGQDTAMARRILLRYTMEKFQTAAEWRSWLDKNKAKLYFTEAGGFKFMVDTFGEPVAASTVLQEQTTETVKGQEPTLSDPVSVSARVTYGADKKTALLVIDAAILKGWHIYAYLPKDSPFISTETILELPQGATIQKDWETSAASPYPGNEGIFVFEGKATFKIALNVAAVKPGAVIRCGLFYQTCDENKCLQPSRKVIEVTI
jgi:hypothetical protein